MFTLVLAPFLNELLLVQDSFGLLPVNNNKLTESIRTRSTILTRFPHTFSSLPEAFAHRHFQTSSARVENIQVAHVRLVGAGASHLLLSVLPKSIKLGRVFHCFLLLCLFVICFSYGYIWLTLGSRLLYLWDRCYGVGPSSVPPDFATLQYSLQFLIVRFISKAHQLLIRRVQQFLLIILCQSIWVLPSDALEFSSVRKFSGKLLWIVPIHASVDLLIFCLIKHFRFFNYLNINRFTI